MDFQTAVRSCLNQYATFTGRASRSEFWWFYLFCFIASVAANLIGFGIGLHYILHDIVALALLLPQLAVGARRLHDIGRSGWWQLIAFTIIGILVLIYWWVKPSDPLDNVHGAAPLPATA